MSEPIQYPAGGPMDESRRGEIKEKFEQLVCIMARLRAPGGCPWDREQTHETLKKYMIEEAYEACDAVDSGQDRELAEELGDVLLQVVFHGQVAAEDSRFDVGDVLDSINTKLVTRHPHVFGDMDLETADDVLREWEIFKKKEKADRKSILDGIPRQMPALLRAHRIQQRAAKAGFDWEQVEDIFTKVREEIDEFEAACKGMNEEEIEDELGDLFFSLVNVARFLEKDSEAALERTILKFTQRFHFIEERVKEAGLDLGKVSIEKLDQYWEEAKMK